MSIAIGNYEVPGLSHLVIGETFDNQTEGENARNGVVKCSVGLQGGFEADEMRVLPTEPRSGGTATFASAS